MLREVAEYPNSFGPLGPGDERIDTDRYTLCLGAGASWNTVQRQRFPVGRPEGNQSLHHPPGGGHLPEVE